MSRGKITDAGHDATEAVLRDVERKVDKVYRQASEEAQAKLERYMQGFTRRDAAKRALVDEGKISQYDYLKWRQGQIAAGDRWREVADTLAQDLTNADKIAMSIVNGYEPEVYAVNANYGTYQIEHGLGIKTSWSLYDRQSVERLIRDEPNLLRLPKVDIPKDRRWNREYINNAVTQALLQGESVQTLAKRIFPEIMAKADVKGKTPQELKGIVRRNQQAAMRNARTAMTCAQNAGRVDSYKRAKDMGIVLKQEWLAAHDGLTRQSHSEIDGEQVEVGEVFSNGLQYPGDPGGPPEEVYNCRCTLIPALGSLDQIKDLDGVEEDDAAKDMSFEEWEENRAAEENLHEQYGQAYLGAPEQYQGGIAKNLDNAPEWARDAWIKSSDELGAPQFDINNGAHFNPSDALTHYESMEKAFDANSYQEEFAVFFHEYGHNIDWALGGSGIDEYISLSFENGAFGDRLREEANVALYNFYESKGLNTGGILDKIVHADDVDALRLYKSEYSSRPAEYFLGRHLRSLTRGEDAIISAETSSELYERMTAGDRKAFEEAFSILRRSKKRDYIERELRDIRDFARSQAVSKDTALEFCQVVKDNFSIYERSDISDMFDAVLSQRYGIEYGMGVGHGKGYFARSDKLPKEAFAEMYSATVTNNQSLEAIKTFFPESYKIFKRMLGGS